MEAMHAQIAKKMVGPVWTTLPVFLLAFNHNIDYKYDCSCLRSATYTPDIDQICILISPLVTPGSHFYHEFRGQ